MFVCWRWSCDDDDDYTLYTSLQFVDIFMFLSADVGFLAQIEIPALFCALTDIHTRTHRHTHTRTDSSAFSRRGRCFCFFLALGFFFVSNS